MLPHAAGILVAVGGPTTKFACCPPSEHMAPVTQTARHRNRAFVAPSLIQRTPLRLLFDGFRGWKYHAKAIWGVRARFAKLQA